MRPLPRTGFRPEERRLNLLPTETHFTQGNGYVLIKSDLEWLYRSVPVWIAQDCTSVLHSPCIVYIPHSILYDYT